MVPVGCRIPVTVGVAEPGLVYCASGEFSFQFHRFKSVDSMFLLRFTSFRNFLLQLSDCIWMGQLLLNVGLQDLFLDECPSKHGEIFTRSSYGRDDMIAHQILPILTQL